MRKNFSWLCLVGFGMLTAVAASASMEIVSDRDLRASLGQRLSAERLLLIGRLGIRTRIDLHDLGTPITPFYRNTQGEFGRRYRKALRCYEVTLRQERLVPNLARSVSCDFGKADIRLDALPEYRLIPFRELGQSLPSVKTTVLMESQHWALDAYPHPEWNFWEDRELATSLGISMAKLVQTFRVEYSRTVSVKWAEDRVIVDQRALWATSKLGVFPARTWPHDQVITFREETDFAFMNPQGKVALFRDVAGLPTAFWPSWVRAGTDPKQRLDERSKIRFSETGRPACFRDDLTTPRTPGCQFLIDEGELFSSSPFELIQIDSESRTIHVPSL